MMRNLITTRCRGRRWWIVKTQVLHLPADGGNLKGRYRWMLYLHTRLQMSLRDWNSGVRAGGDDRDGDNEMKIVRVEMSRWGPSLYYSSIQPCGLALLTAPAVKFRT